MNGRIFKCCIAKDIIPIDRYNIFIRLRKCCIGDDISGICCQISLPLYAKSALLHMSTFESCFILNPSIHIALILVLII